MTFFRKKFPFSRPKFLMTCFVIDHVFQIFPSFFRFSISLLCEMSYMTLSSQDKPPFLLCSYSRAYPTTLLLKILGNGCMGRPPPQIWGTVPPVPLGLRPWKCVMSFSA